ncbi:MAG: UDP-N-acetylmuramate dehydrogenase [Candidatus Dependentiae bacterium]|nr:UDP-N-acetylmuramate dehydrogenase [Candidatus Dependentiae bacterium]
MSTNQFNIMQEQGFAPALVMQENISLRDKNWFNTGGPARFFCEPRTIAEFQEALQYANIHALPLFVLGQGANVVISDDGFNGLVIRPQLNFITVQERIDTSVILHVGAGAHLSAVITYCLGNNILGLEEFSGIPGTIGGSIYINVHYYGFLLAQFIQEATIIHKKTGATKTVPASWFEFGYDQSRLQAEEYFVVSASFNLKPCTDLEAAYARGRSVEIIRHRVSRYPSKGTCGSFFRNFHDHEVHLIINNKKMIYSAYYLDKIGVKGALNCGDASVSYQHANMLVNNGTATTHDIITIARTMQEKVYEQFGVMLRPECLLIGFDTYPLLDKDRE